MPDVTPDSRPAARIKDPDALRRARLRFRSCAACGAPAGGVHHLIPRGEGGDDVIANLLGLCGHGTMRCHGALHGSPYVAEIPPAYGGATTFAHVDERRDALWVTSRIGRHVAAHRPDSVAYVLGKLGADAGADYLLRRYQLEIP